jgi:hypothetical protein
VAKYPTLLAAALLALGISARANAPDKSFTKFDGEMYGTAAGTETGYFSGTQELSVMVPPGMEIDTSYSEGDIVCCKNNEHDNAGPIAVPAGIYIEIDGWRWEAHNLYITPIVDDASNETRGYKLWATLSCGAGRVQHCEVYLKAWIKLRPHVAPDAQLAPPNPSAGEVLNYKPTDGTPQALAETDTDITRTDLGEKYRYAITFSVPSATPNIPVPFDQLSVFGFRKLGPAGGSAQTYSRSITYLLLQGQWNPTERVSITVDVPKAVVDPDQGWKLVFCIGSMGHGCVRGPELLSGAPPVEAQAAPAPVASAATASTPSMEASVNGASNAPAPASSANGPEPSLAPGAPAKSSSKPERYRPMLGAAPSSNDMNSVVTKTDEGDHVQLVIAFTAPQASPSMPAPFDLIKIYGYQRVGPAGNRPKMLPADTYPYLHGNWSPGNRITITLNVPKQYSDATQGWNLTLCIGTTSAGCVPSPNLLTGERIRWF